MSDTSLEPARELLPGRLGADPDVIALGRAIYFDQRLSTNGNQS